ncbi:MAG: MerR family transcriptional regulator [Candidatus Zixiibacteriota bacterium]|nr:MAG: MerR family transcriptional regulator [candidate division Zixibacteria bacterium]
MPSPEPRKLYYSIGEVSEMTGLPASVLRFWETEFKTLRPPKNRAGKRTYRAADIDRILLIKRLLYEDGFTIAGARKVLQGEVAVPPPRAESAGEPPEGEMTGSGPVMEKIRRELREILDLLSS